MKKLIFLFCAFILSVQLNAQIFDMIKDKVKEKAVDKVTNLSGEKAKNLITTDEIENSIAKISALQPEETEIQ